MPAHRIGAVPMTSAERQARHRAKLAEGCIPWLLHCRVLSRQPRDRSRAAAAQDSFRGGPKMAGGSHAHFRRFTDQGP